MNIKISKIISNALNWQIDFNGFKHGKLVLIIPATGTQLRTQDGETAGKDERELFAAIEGQRTDINLPVIQEERQGGTNPTNEEQQYQVAESYPLKRPRKDPEVLLVSYSDVKNVLETKIGFKCDDCNMEENALALVKKAIRNKQDKGKAFYKYVLVDLDDITIIIERFGRALKRLLQEAGIKPDEVKFYAFSSNDSEKIQRHCARAHFTFFIKPNKNAQIDTFRHMALEDEDYTPGSNAVSPRGGLMIPAPGMVKQKTATAVNPRIHKQQYL